MNDQLEQLTSQEQQIAEECEREFCTHEALKRYPVRVADVEQEWCLTCVHEEFGVDVADYETRQQSILRYVTPATVAAFCLGSLLTLVIASMLII